MMDKNTIQTINDWNSWFDDEQRAMLTYMSTKIDEGNWTLKSRYYDGDVVQLLETTDGKDGHTYINAAVHLTPKERDYVLDVIEYAEDVDHECIDELTIFPPNEKIEVYGTHQDLQITFHRKEGCSDEIVKLTDDSWDAVKSFLRYAKTIVEPNSRFDDIEDEPR